MVGTVIGKYRIAGSLGRGATGIVYRAVDETLGREVAIKILSSAAAESDLMKRFRTEAAALAKLNHPGIATIYELFSSGSELVMAMEFVPGQTLEQLSERDGPLPPARAVHLVDRILAALEHAHRAGIIHRDMKPANVMVRHDGAVKIMDFGIARVRGVEHFTVDGCLMGTPAYMAPEHVRGEPVDERADLYAVGVIFYRLLTGRLPFDADSTVIMLQKHISEAPAALQAHRADLPPWCESIVQRAMAKLPAQRFQTASEFRIALSRAAGATGAQTDDERHADAPGAAAGVAPREKTAVLSRQAAAAIRNSVRSPAAVRRAGFVTASLLLVIQGTAYTPPTVRVTQPAAAAASAAVLAPPAERAARPAPAPSAAAVTARKAPNRMAAPPAVAAPAAKTYPGVAFVTKGLVETGGEPRVRDVRLVLAANSLAVTDDATRERLQVVPYADVSAITYSHGRDPMWNSSDGPTRIVRTSGRFSRVLGMSGRHHWISLRTRSPRRFVILQVTDSQVSDVLSALEERTGRTPQLLEPLQGTD